MWKWHCHSQSWRAPTLEIASPIVDSEEPLQDPDALKAARIKGFVAPLCYNPFFYWVLDWKVTDPCKQKMLFVISRPGKEQKMSAEI